MFSGTILDKTTEIIAHFQSIFLNILAGMIFPFSPPLGSNVVFKSNPDPWTFVESNFDYGEGDLAPQVSSFRDTKIWFISGADNVN